MSAAAGARVPEWHVEVYLYDLSQGMAAALSPAFLGKQIEGIWHTGIVVYGHEYFYGGGICATRPGTSLAGQPMRRIDMGWTRRTPPEFHEFLRSVSSRFTAETYSLLEHNCNNFTNEAALFLVGRPIPSYITGLPVEALNTPLGQMLRPMIAQMEQGMRGGAGAGGGGAGAGMMGGAIPWAAQTLDLPRGLDNIPGERMVDPNSNTQAPHSTVEAAAALAAAAMNQAAAAEHQAATGAAPAATPASSSTPTSPASVTASSSNVISVLSRTHPAKPLQSADKKARSFQILLKSNAKKHHTGGGQTGLTAEQEALITNLVNTLSSEDSVASSKTLDPSAIALIDSFVHNWPAALQFPVLGLVRLMVLRREVIDWYNNQEPANNDGSTPTSANSSSSSSSSLSPGLDRFVSRLTQLLPKEEGDQAAPSEVVTNSPSNVAPHAAQSMALCTLSNLFIHADVAASLVGRSSVWSCIRACLLQDHQTVKLMAATLMYNACVCMEKQDESDTMIEAVTFLIDRIPREASSPTCSCDVLARMLLALSEIVVVSSSAAALMVGLEFNEALDLTSTKHSASHAQVAQSIKDLQTIIHKTQQEMNEVA